MNVDILLVIMLIGLIGAYIYIVSKRKREERNELTEQKQVEEEEKKAKEKKLASTYFNLDRFKQEEDTYAGHLIDYSRYKLSKKEFIFYSIIAGFLFGLIGQLFYESWIAAGVLASLGLLYPYVQKKRLLEKRKEKLSLQFKEAIASLSSSLAAGRSIENSFKEVVEDLKLLYPDPNTYIIHEFEVINRRVENGETIERAIEDFSKRSDIEDIQNFSDIFITCKRTGGNLVEVIRRTSDIISEKIDIQQEVSVMVAQKRFESKVLSIAPIGMILLLKYSAGDYMAPLYQWEHMGPIVMTICLIILAVSYWISQKIMDIRV
ncbi:type II secretion system F family protein [Thalassobacillus hwangdonensis]|uniref:Type II secretion system F family protein n=1 Tax=Thalassobacillus hwangdonensis TaxID=546108 RepID=A0ABW3KY35_9BACI